MTFIVYAALTGATFLLPLVLQIVSGYSPLASGLALVPLTVIMLALSARSGQIAAQIGPRLQLGPRRGRPVLQPNGPPATVRCTPAPKTTRAQDRPGRLSRHDMNVPSLTALGAVLAERTADRA